MCAHLIFLFDNTATFVWSINTFSNETSSNRMSAMYCCEYSMCERSRTCHGYLYSAMNTPEHTIPNGFDSTSHESNEFSDNFLWNRIKSTHFHHLHQVQQTFSMPNGSLVMDGKFREINPLKTVQWLVSNSICAMSLTSCITAFRSDFELSESTLTGLHRKYR